MKRVIFILLVLALFPQVIADTVDDHNHEEEVTPDVVMSETPERNATADVGVFLVLMALPFIITWMVYHHRKMSQKEIQLQIREYL